MLRTAVSWLFPWATGTHLRADGIEREIADVGWMCDMPARAAQMSCMPGRFFFLSLSLFVRVPGLWWIARIAVSWPFSAFRQPASRCATHLFDAFPFFSVPLHCFANLCFLNSSCLRFISDGPIFPLRVFLLRIKFACGVVFVADAVTLVQRFSRLARNISGEDRKSVV